MPIQTCKILSTKQLPEATLADARARGISLECVPFIEIKYRSPDMIAAMLCKVSPRDLFIFTSKHAIIAAQHILATYKNDAYCISGSTKEALHTLTKMKPAGTASNARLLCECIRPDPGRNYFFCCGNKRLNTVPGYLTAHGITYHEIVCYDTELLTKKVETIYAAVLFFSPSAVGSYFTWNRPYTHQHFYCIGATTAAAVKKYASQNVFIANEPSVASLISQIEQTKTR